jgi:serine/threonine-protein kinase
MDSDDSPERPRASVGPPGTSRTGKVATELHGKYRILAELGQGGTALVWLAVARGPSGFNKLVVLKSMKPELSDEPELAQMFLNEAKLAARLNHPNIVQTNEVFEHEGRPVIVMEYLDGQPLSEVLTRDRQQPGFPLGMQLRVLSEVLGGLHAAHELTDFDGTPLYVVHRDVSPHNMFVTYDGLVKLLDFGIAVLVGVGNRTESGVVKGKLHYMAPEQITNGPVDRRADVYACGVILWEMAAGVRMWRGLNEAVLMNRILSGQLPRLTEVNPAADPYLEELVARATSRDREGRYPSAADFQLDLDEYLAATDPVLRTRDIGGAVTRMFAERRRERAAIIERQLARIASLTDDEYQGAEPIPLPRLELQLERSASFTRPRPLRASQLLPWVLIAALVSALVYLLLDTPTPTAPLVLEGGDSTSHARHPAAAAQGEVVRLRVTAFPAEARLLLDDVELEGNPHLGTYAKDDATPHLLRGSAAGYETVTRELRLSDDQDLVLTLRRAAPKAETAARPSRGAPARPAAVRRPAEQAARPAPPAAPPTTRCEPPYYFDERGIKKYKPECL